MVKKGDPNRSEMFCIMDSRTKRSRTSTGLVKPEKPNGQKTRQATDCAQCRNQHRSNRSFWLTSARIAANAGIVFCLLPNIFIVNSYASSRGLMKSDYELK